MISGFFPPSSRVYSLRLAAARWATWRPVDVSPVEIRLSFAMAAADWDHDGYDDGIDVRVHPKDKYGDTVKAAGSFEMELKRPPLLHLPGSQPVSVCRWRRDAHQTNDAWVDSTFSGFYFKLEWPDARPESGMVMIEVTYISPLGRTLTASKGDIEVHMCLLSGILLQSRNDHSFRRPRDNGASYYHGMALALGTQHFTDISG